jgi:glycosyltransferase involved in cell wall biosynthesis
MSISLAERGHEIRVLTTESRPGPDYSTRHERFSGIEIERVNLRYFVDRDPDGWELGMRRWRQHERRVALMLEAHLDVWRPDVVQYHTTRPFGEIAPQVIARAGIPIVAFFHEGWFICPRLMLLRSPRAEPCSGPGAVKCIECMYSNYDGSDRAAISKLAWRVPRIGVYFAYRLLRRKSARHTLTAGLALSRYMVEVHQPHVSGQVILFPHGINLEGLPKDLPSRPRKPLRFGFVGGFQPNKGIWDVHAAAASLKRDGFEFELHVWGPNGPGDEREVAKRGLEDRVRLRGMYQPSGIWDVFCQVDVAVMATTVPEPHGRIPDEARAVGAPTIAPAIGGLRESIRHGIDGLLYTFKDPDDLERQMRRILAEPELFETLSAGLRPVIDTRTRGAALEAVYESILEGRATAAAR